MAKEGHVKIYLDGAKAPAVDLPFIGYFDGKHEPFTRPNLVYKTKANGFDNFTPIPFQKSCKIVADKEWGSYYHFNYTTFPEGTVVPTFKIPLSQEDSAALDQANVIMGQCGQDPAGNRPNQKMETHSLTVPAGGKAVAMEFKGPQAITAIKVKMELPKEVEKQRALLAQLTMSMTWDNESAPAVWSPLGDFFASAAGAVPFQTLPVGLSAGGIFYCYSYMPFGDKALHSQPVNENNQGHVSVNRWHLADNIPFQTSFEGDIEKYFSNDERLTLYAAVAYWYLNAGGKEPYAAVPVSERIGWWTRPGGRVIKGSELVDRAVPSKQPLHGLKSLTNGAANPVLLWPAETIGETLALKLPVPEAGKYRVCARFSRGPNYGTHQLSLNGRKVGYPANLLGMGPTDSWFGIAEAIGQIEQNRGFKKHKTPPIRMKTLLTSSLALMLATSFAAGEIQAPVKLKVMQDWDDSLTTDLPMIELLKKYKAKATFNIIPNKVRRSFVVKKLKPDKGTAFSFMPAETPEAIEPRRRVLMETMVLIRENSGQDKIGFVYPGGNYNKTVMQAVQDAGYLYARTTKSVDAPLPLDIPMALPTICKWDSTQFWKRYEAAKKKGGVFYFWGHSCELGDDPDLWKKLETIYAHISADPDADKTWSCDSLPLSAIRQSFIDGKEPSIVTRTDDYELIHTVHSTGDSSIRVKNTSPAGNTLSLLVRSADPAGNPIDKLSWDGTTLHVQVIRRY